jgi:hypothetical protein
MEVISRDAEHGVNHGHPVAETAVKNDMSQVEANIGDKYGWFWFGWGGLTPLYEGGIKCISIF